VPRYRLYFIDPHPRHIREIVDFEAVDDATAKHHARGRRDGRAQELWCGDRMIQAIPAEGR
jgi:hypothetical protein